MTFKEVYSILLEKDFRSKILALGMPQDVADYLHGMNDKYSFWFADQINKMPEYQAARNKEMFVHSLQTQMQGIIDWIRGGIQNISLKDYDWNTALSFADEYHKKLTITNIERETNTILKEYADGFYWVDLESSSDTCEAGAMGHCANTSKGDTLYSLRKYNIIKDAIESFITIAVSPDEGVWFQCKGKNNSKPKKEYYSYIADILVSKNILTFKTEYNPKNDFKTEELKEYLEENPNVFPNTDEILEKINEDTISIDDFQKILDRYREDFNFYSIDVNNDFDDLDVIYPNYNFHLSIQKSETDLPIDCLTLDYRSKGRDALNDCLDVYLSDINVDNFENKTTIYGIIEDSDSSFSLDEIGLRSFERQCEYYKGLNEKFDKEEFLKEDLEKILYLDNCIKIKRDSFEEDVKKELGDFYQSNINKRTLELTIHIQTPNNLFQTPVIEKLSHNSALNGYDNIVPTEKDFLENYKNGATTKHADFLAIVLFWQSVKKDILVNVSKHMKIGISNTYGVLNFPISFIYDFEDSDEIDYDYEYRCLQILENKSQEIQRSLLSFYNSVFIKILNNKEEFNIKPDNLKFVPLGNGSVSISTINPYYYLGILPEDQLTTPNVKKLADSKGLTGDYKSLDVSLLKQWLNDNMGSTPMLPGFKDFFENYKNKSNKILKEGLIKTYPMPIAIKKMNEKWDDFLTDKFRALDPFTFVGKVISTPVFNLEKLKKDALFFGYFLSSISKSGNILTLSFVPKFSEKDKVNKDTVLYHLCPNKALPKILKIGITPRLSSKKDWPHPGDRSYLLKVNFNKTSTYAIDTISALFGAIASASNSTLEDYSVIKIKNDNDLIESLRIDPSFEGNENSEFYGVYTNKNIPPSMFDKVMNIKEFQKDFIRETINPN
jgi:hypothetical protein